jgi:hypothetical protein
MKILLTALLALFFQFRCLSQTIEREIISTAGGYTTTPDIIISFTLGDLAVLSLEKDKYMINQGFEKGSDYLISGWEEELTRNLFSVFPNPTDGIFQVTSNVRSAAPVYLELYTAVGEKVIERNLIPGDPVHIDFRHFPDGIYLLKIVVNESYKPMLFRIMKK